MKILLGLQARTNSKRLPKKVMRKINGNPLLFYVLERLKKSKLSDKIYVLTSTEQGDQTIANYCKENKINIYLGNLNDVLSRYYDFVKEKKIDAVIRISADSPLIDFNLVNKMHDLFLKNNHNYDIITNVFPRTFPKGQSVEIIKSSTLKFLTQSNLKVDEKEHVTSFIYKNPKIFKILNYEYTKNQSSLRLSIDNKNDFLNFKSFAKTNTNFLNYNLDKIIEEWKEKKN